MKRIGLPDAKLHDFYHANGFAPLPRLVDDSELAWLREVYDGVFNATAYDRGDYYDIAGSTNEKAGLPQVIRPEKYAPELLASQHFARCRTIAATFLDLPESSLDFYGHAIFKPPHYGAPTPWHQDEAYMSPQWYRRGLSIWTTLDDATADSGCLSFIPGLHRGPVLGHRHIDHDATIRGLTTDEVDASTAVSCPLGPGEASVHDFRTPHYAGPNQTARPRRAYVLVFMGEAARVQNPDPRPWRNEDEA